MTDTADIPIAPQQAKALRRMLLAWYRRNMRDLPWRSKNGQRPDAYHTLVSETMLQQTQVATVVPYFHRFIEAFPTVHALAEADEQRVLTLWQGLGYYRRARNLHAAAKSIVDHFAGEVPRSTGQLLELPGVGRYTAGAIASIAHGKRAAVVDGNVERVFARLLKIEDPINAPATKKLVWSIAESLVPKSSPGDYNQALMELGATVCTPKLPQCFVCPVREHCRGVQEADPEALPVKLAKKKPKAVTHIVIAAQRKGKYLFEQRPGEGLWSNMWQLPTWEEPPAGIVDFFPESDRSRRVTTRGAKHDTPPATRPPRADAAAALAALADWFTGRCGLRIDLPTRSAEFTHQTTHRTIRFVLLRATVRSGRLKPNAGVWRAGDRLDDLPMSNPQRYVLKQIKTG